MNATSPRNVLGLGLYPLPEAARLAQIDARTARRWAEGNAYKVRGEPRRSPGVLPLTLGPSGSTRDLTFAEMLSLRLVRGFRKAGLGLPTIKRVAKRAAEDFGFEVPFVSRRFRTDGRKVFIELHSEKPANDEPAIPRQERELIEVLTGQKAFQEVVEPSLFANVDWDDELAAKWWPLGKERSVILDPRVLFGAPRVANTSVPTAVLAAAVTTEGGGSDAIEAVADWYGVTPQHVADAVSFETEWLRKSA